MVSKQKEDEFKLRIAGISLGNHRFSIVCDREFFEIAGITELQEGALNLDIIMERKETMLDISFHFKGEVVVPCDRCLDPVSLPMDFKEHLIVKLVSFAEEDTEDEKIWIINENEYEIDIFHFVYEAIRLSLPIQIIHPDRADGSSTCNPEILKQLEELSQKEEEQSDPRWNALKDINFD